SDRTVRQGTYRRLNFVPQETVIPEARILDDEQCDGRECGGPAPGGFLGRSCEASNEGRLSVYRRRNLSGQQTILLFADCAANSIEPERHGFLWRRTSFGRLTLLGEILRNCLEPINGRVRQANCLLAGRYLALSVFRLKTCNAQQREGAAEHGHNHCTDCSFG